MTGDGEKHSALVLRWVGPFSLFLLALGLGGCGSFQFGWEIEGQQSLGAATAPERGPAEEPGGDRVSRAAPASDLDPAPPSPPVGEVTWVGPTGDFAVVRLSRILAGEGPVFLLGTVSRQPEDGGGEPVAVLLTRGGVVGRSVGAEVLEGKVRPRLAVRLPRPAQVDRLARRFGSAPGLSLPTGVAADDSP